MLADLDPLRVKDGGEPVAEVGDRGVERVDVREQQRSGGRLARLRRLHVAGALVVTVSVVAPAHLTLAEAHDLASRLEDDIHVGGRTCGTSSSTPSRERRSRGSREFAEDPVAGTLRRAIDAVTQCRRQRLQRSGLAGELTQQRAPALEVRLTDELLDRIDEIVPPGTDVGTLDQAFIPAPLQHAALRRRPLPERAAV